MEAMTQEFMLHRRPHVEIWSAEKVLTTTPARSTSEIKLWWIPNNVNKEQEVHFRNHKTDGSPNPISNHGPLQKPKSDENPNHKPKDHKELHLRNQILMDLNKHILMSIWSTSETKHLMDQNKTWTKHRCSSLDPITHPTNIGGKSQNPHCKDSP